MRFNASKALEVFYRLPAMEPMTILPRFCFDDEVVASIELPCLSDGVRLDEFMRRKSDATVCLWRTYALGDILVLTPLINSLKEAYPQCKVVLATADGFLSLFKYWDLVKTIVKNSAQYEGYDIGYYLDGVVEKDHAGDAYSYKHRLDINCDFVGWPVPKDPIFSLPYSDVEKQWAQTVVATRREEGKPVAVMQLSGAMWFNRFPLGKTMEIAAELSKVCSVIMIHNLKQDVEVKGITNLAGQTTFQELAALIDSADVAITMDSGALWVAHCTKTPIIAMFGHTRAKEKMAHHRNYHSIDLAEMVGCQSCFGRQTRCKGTAECLKKSDTERIIQGIKIGLSRLVFS
jgi:ADP-heptose:LPS heptosyltransferase